MQVAKAKILESPPKHYRQLLLLLQALQADQFKVPALACQQLVVCTRLNNLASVEDVDDIGFLDGAKTMGDSEGGAALGGGIKCRLDDLL